MHNVLALQIQGYLSAESALEKHRAVLEKAKLAAQILPRNSEEIETKIRAQNHLNSVAQYGGEKPYFERVLIEEFSEHEACSPTMQQIIREQISLTLQGKDPGLVKQARQKAIFTGLAENMLALMLPVRKKIGANGDVEEVEPFMQLWEKLYLPKEFHELIKHVEELVSEFITPETATLFASIKQPALNIIQNMIKSAGQDMLKKQLVQVVQKAFEKLTLPANLDELNANVTLPAINAQLIKTLIAQQLSPNAKAAAPLFHALLVEQAPRRETNIKAIQELLIKLTKENFNHFTGKNFYVKEENSQLSYRDLTDSDWQKLTLPLIKQTERQLLDTFLANGKPLDTALITVEKIYEQLSKRPAATDTSNDPVFGQMFMDLMFKIGNWPYEGLIGFFAKDKISSQLTEETRELRASHAIFISSLTATLKETFLNRQAVEEMFLSNPSLKPSQYTPQKLTHQMAVLSRLAHDLIFYFAGQQGLLSKFAVKQVVTDNPKAIDALIKTIYQKVFGNQTLNENLVIRVCEEIFRSMSESAVALHNIENFRIHHALAKSKAIA